MVYYERSWEDETTGLEITVQPSEKQYEVTVKIPTSALKMGRFFQKERFGSIWVTTKKKIHIPLVITYTKAYRIVKRGLVSLNSKSFFEIDTPEYYVKVILNPTFYVPKERRATKRNLKDAHIETTKYNVPRRKKREKTNYTHNNVAHPYSGGLVIPK